jgi:short-subunit dehydrogenase
MAAVALITGASSGIGEEFARRLSARGYGVILVARRAERLERLAAELRSAGAPGVEVLPADLATEAGLVSVEERVRDEARLELLVNNAGFGTRGLFHEADPLLQDRMHRLHVIATMRLTRAALPGMVARRKGGIINVSSVAAFNATPSNVSYCATKAWMNRFTEGLALELAAAGSPVKVQALCPGFTRTEFHQVLGVGYDFIGKGWWMPAGEVVEASLKGLEKGKVIVIPGLRYKVLVWLSRITPGALQRGAILLYARRTGRIPGATQ